MATTADFTVDAIAGVHYLWQRPDIDHEQVALLGHSEGGLIAPRVAVAEPGVAAIVLMAGPGATGRAVVEVQLQLILEAELAELNHLFQHSESGALAEYSQIEETLAPEFLDLVTEWLRDRLGLQEPGTRSQ